jgi:SAM-dependent methyltransferase
MTDRSDSDDALGAEELRAGFLRYTRQAYTLLPDLVRPRILDIGCGSGLSTIALARLSGGEVVGIDTDEPSLRRLRQRTEEAGVGGRVVAVHASLYDADFGGEEFDVLWEEGVLHLLDPASSVPACYRLLEAGGSLVMHETVAWFEGIRERLPAFGFGVTGQLLLPGRCWWTDYYAPLESRIRTLREGRGNRLRTPGLARYDREIAMVKADPDRFDSGFFIVHKAS